MSFRIFATCDIGWPALNRLEERGYRVEVHLSATPPSKSLIIEKVRSGIDGLITTRRDEIDGEVLEVASKTLKVVAQIEVGFDNINRAAANRFRIPFTHTPNVLTEAAAEFAFFMLGAVARKLWPSERLVRENRWGAWHPFFPFLGNEVTGKTIAIIGTGRVGLALIKKCVGLDMNILCCDPHLQHHDYVRQIQEQMDLRHRHGIQRDPTSIRYVEFEQALSEADFVSLHVPLLRQGESETPTFHLLNDASLRLMKASACLINTSHGGAVDESALAKALKERRIAGAALDVYETEPLPSDSPLRDPEIEDRCRLFHHFASGTTVTRLSPDPDTGMAGRCVQGLIDVLKENYGGDLVRMPYVVNKEAFAR